MLLLPPAAVQLSLKSICDEPSNQVPQTFNGPGGNCRVCGATKMSPVICHPLISLQQGPTLADYKWGLGGTFPGRGTEVTAPTMSTELQLFPVLQVRSGTQPRFAAIKFLHPGITCVHIYGGKEKKKIDGLIPKRSIVLQQKPKLYNQDAV